MKDTLIFFTSDNGPEGATSGMATPFKDRKRSMMEGTANAQGQHPHSHIGRRHKSANNSRLGRQDKTQLRIRLAR